ncbi:precorrin-8w decarboxylase [Thermoplasma volcanium GSS1]|uniref:Probable cobalt-precorrin-6B C(15)-methyltransferase (decarboxylating) n=1 Tax=Thermoplasma volcanium (strain ATCC 51530 / DSM 4299 / JCM 9571 / NBRC 15438 / GSS1) TaxID=273116 RepID=CBIT_THEVO|nr:precorrin-6Y C5,15-methyltransferase (decarboxylating) subunit CbiT [Thermoplasma volcanium]Q97A64.1 RecName: Full=Probable cobalt-precorrin-6B C(15)-methyltransferase (decarboxylating) [Thermoplasma volcanium GSS1]BAB60088.1 precorrin-8w decarboxylase [Thermoplasma volcanium GSS1]
MESEKSKFDYYIVTPDSLFERVDGIPMTKEEIRLISLNRLGVRNGGHFLDIGTGTGSVAVDMSRLAGPNGKIIALDRDEKAIKLARINLDRLSPYKNIQLVLADAYAYSPADSFDAIFIGGGTGDLPNLVSKYVPFLKSGARVVINAIQVKTLNDAVESLELNNFRNVSVIEVQISVGMKTGSSYAMIARNPIFVVSGEQP